ncbi:MAG: SH3 domain-containing protein [Deltaproteobacteria bacterium]|nr:MAG: SH3 domain-containing protein [Deltaproteobacteria bacterium]
MTRWLVTQNNTQFAVEDLAELKRLASTGKVTAGDMVQPPGATEWLYASEVPELASILAPASGDDDFDVPKSGVPAVILGAVLVVLIVVGAAGMWTFGQQLPTGHESMMDQMSYSQMLVTDPAAQLRSGPEANAGAVQALSKDAKLELLAKRGDMYKARTEAGVEGWIAENQVIPMYQLGGAEVRADYDPLYNPDRYVRVSNASWLQLDQENEQVTVFQFMITNDSKFDMTDLMLLATIKDSKGNELETVEIPVEGILPAGKDTMVGTLDPDPDVKVKPDEEPPASRSLTHSTYEGMVEDDPDLQLRWREGVEVTMEAEDFTEANIDILEIRAIPKKS